MYQSGTERIVTPVKHQRICVGWRKGGWTAGFNGCEELPVALEEVLRGWKVEAVQASGCKPVSMQFERVDGGYRWDAPDDGLSSETLYGQPGTPAAAIADINYMLNGWFVRQFDDVFTLHCAAVRIGDGAVLFPAEHRAGKSLLSVALASRGHTVFGDDVIAIERSSLSVLSLGVLPRLRLPLPPQATSPQLRRFINAHCTVADQAHAYIDPGAHVIAAVGETCRIKAIVHLRRLNRPAAAQLGTSNAAGALRSLIRQNYSRNLPASEVFDDLCSLAGQVTCLELSYHQVDDAVRLLEGRFAGGQPARLEEDQHAGH
jgi:hypothetical protein